MPAYILLLPEIDDTVKMKGINKIEIHITISNIGYYIMRKWLNKNTVMSKNRKSIMEIVAFYQKLILNLKLIYVLYCKSNVYILVLMHQLQQNKHRYNI